MKLISRLHAEGAKIEKKAGDSSSKLERNTNEIRAHILLYSPRSPCSPPTLSSSSCSRTHLIHISLPNRDSFECPGSKRGSRSPLVRPLRLSMEREGIESFQNTGTSADKSVMMGV